MLITVMFDSYAKLIECDNLSLADFPKLLEDFEDWLYEEEDNCLCVRKDLNIDILDITVVLRFFADNYPNCAVKVSDNIAIENVDQDSPIIAL